MTQPEAVLEYMARNGKINQMIANYRLGVSRLPAIILVLKKRGIRIEDEWEDGTDRNGNYTHWKNWYLAEN